MDSNLSFLDLSDDSSTDESLDMDELNESDRFPDLSLMRAALFATLSGGIFSEENDANASSTTTVDTYCDRVRASTRELRQLQSVDIAAYRHLCNIYQIYQELHHRNNKDAISKIGDVLIAENILDIFVRFWDECHENPDALYNQPESVMFQNLFQLKNIFWNYTDGCRRLGSEFYRNGVAIERIMSEFSMPQLAVSSLTQKPLRFMMMANLSILHNVVRHENQNKDHIRKNNGIDKILAYQKSPDEFIKATVFIVLAYCIEDKENSKVAGFGVIDYLLKILKAAVKSAMHQDSGFHADETVAALYRLALNDDNKKAIVDAGALPILSKLLDDQNSSDDERFECVRCLWSLSFHEDNKKKIREAPGLVDRMKSLKKAGIGKELEKEIDGLLCYLTAGRSVKRQNSGKDKHVMISYNWDVQGTMVDLKNYLTSKGIKTWMDVDDMHGPIEDAMAEAVENAALIVIALTEKYKNSNACRSEGLYAHRRKVPVVPLILQPGYDANGWLGLIIASGKWVDLTSDDYERNFPQVLDEVRCLMKETAADGIQAATSAENTVKVSLKFSDRTRKYEGEYQLDETIYDVIADIMENTNKKVCDIQHSKTKKILDEDLTIEDLRENGYLDSLTAILE